MMADDYTLTAIKRPWVPEFLFAMFRWAVLYQPFRWLLTEPAPLHAPRCARHAPQCGGVYRCAGCRRLSGYCLGASDDMPDHCDACWCAAHPEES
jgi:hypothetical protein